MDKIMSIDSEVRWNKLSRRISRSQSLQYNRNSRLHTMPACMPANDVSDINRNTAHPPGQNDSKLTKIMTCLFWKKKTDVVDIDKNGKASARKKKMAVDRSERSRRVLKMESMRETPKTRDATDETRPAATGPKQMFLPSENPTASFLSYLNPSVRRACSEVIRTSSTAPSVNKNVKREAFTDYTLPRRTRNTNYRGQRATEKTHETLKNGTIGNKPPKLPERSQSQKTTPGYRKPIVVPGTMISSDDDIGYNSDNDISDLHDELRRMNISQPELRNRSYSESGAKKHKGRRREGSISLSEESLSAEGSISLSEGSDSDENGVTEDRPNNPSPGQPAPTTGSTDPLQSQSNDKSTADLNGSDKVKNYRGPKNKIMEEVIDALYMQTQQNIDNIYHNGLEHMDLETYRSETASPDTCMRVYEDDLVRPKENRNNDVPAENVSTGHAQKRVFSKPAARNQSFTARNSVTHGISGLSVSTAENDINENGDYTPQMDNLLSEVSIWAKDRQNWLLEDGKMPDDNEIGRENTDLTVRTDDRAIDQVTKTNSDKCNEWMNDQNEPQSKNKDKIDTKVNGILMGPKLFRSTAKIPNARKVSFNENKNKEGSERNEMLPGKRTHRGVKISDLLTNDVEEINAQDTHETEIDGQSINENNTPEGNVEPWTSDMYNTTTEKAEDDRSTLNDNLSEADQKARFVARSPDSWLSSVGSYMNLTNKQSVHDDSFETVSSHNTGSTSTTKHVKISADEPAKSHQILRQAPVVHAPFRMNRETTPMPSDSVYIPAGKPMMRNTQLRPLPAPRPVKTINTLNEITGLKTFPSLPAMKGEEVLKGSRNMNEPECTSNPVTRPFSEIPLRQNHSDRNPMASNSRLLADNWAPPVPPRPASETMPPKRSDKIGMGNIMATDSTKERNKYARDIVKSFQNQKLQPQQDAFDTGTDNGGEKTTKKKRHTVFDNNLLKGGYTYDKHSRARPSNPAGKNNGVTSGNSEQLNGIFFEENHNHEHERLTEQTNVADPKLPSPRSHLHLTGNRTKNGYHDLTQAMSIKRSEETGASISQLNIDIRDSKEFNGRNKLAGYGINKLSPRQSLNSVPTMSNLVAEFPAETQSKVDVKIRGVSNKGSYANTSNTSVQNHSHSVIGGQGLNDSQNISHTAEKFKTLRTRRDQEIDWLMRDAAETEV